MLPYRPHNTPLADIFKRDPGGEEDESKFEKKACAPVIPARSNLSAALLSDQEYEFVPTTEPVREASDSDSDSNGFVEVKHEDLSGDQAALPIRHVGGAGNADTPNAAESDSDSDWTRL